MIKERGKMKDETRDQLREQLKVFLRENDIETEDIAKEIAKMSRESRINLDNDVLREQMKAFIQINGLRQEYVAEELLGFASGHFSKFLNGKRTMGAKSLQRVANLLDTYEVKYNVF